MSTKPKGPGEAGKLERSNVYETVKKDRTRSMNVQLVVLILDSDGERDEE